MRASLVLIVAALSLLFIVACDGGSGSNNNTNVSEPPVEPPIEPPSVSPADNAVTVDGKVWLQPVDFTGYRYDQVNAACPIPDGICSGSLQGSTFDLTGYKWASIMDVSSLFNAYGVDPPFTGPFQRRNDDSAAIAMSQDFTISGEWCFGDCPFGFDFVMGIVRDEAPTGMPPYLPYVDAGDCIEASDVDCEFSNTTGFDSDEIQTPDDGIGIWFWKPAEQHTVSVDGKEWLQPDLFTNLSWNDINAVCPEGACAGTLPGTAVDLTGFLWASSIDVSDLFTAYSDKEEFFLDFRPTGIFIFNDGDDDNVPTTVGMTREPPGPLDPEDPSDVERINVAGVIPQYEQFDFIEEVRFFTDDSVVPGEGEYGYGVWFYRPTGG